MTADWVLYAGIAAWTGIGLYLFLLGRKQAALSLRIRQMELMGGDEAEPKRKDDAV